MTVPSNNSNDGLLLDLMAAPLPMPFGFALHHWLLVTRRNKITRWEVWQFPDCGGTSWGHLHKDFLPPLADMGNGKAIKLNRFEGQAALDVVTRLDSCADHYPFCHKYRYWPGPNSNTFVQWALGEHSRLGWRGFGKRYPVRS